MVGDTPWDVEAAGKAGVSTLAVMTGGFAIAELEEAGAAAACSSRWSSCASGSMRRRSRGAATTA
jgi:phosphoglycolate phosphatase-like HAD superfamily hydrolase